MRKNKFTRLLTVIMAFVMVTALAGCDQTEPTAADVTYTVTIENSGGMSLGMCKVEVYADAAKTAMVYSGIANAEGQISFTAAQSNDYVVVLSKLPQGYAVADSYVLTGESTTIVLTPRLMTDEDMDSVRYSLGDVIMDFSVTAPDGTQYVLSQLLQEKKAVVLNFWFLNCMPCKMEFPYLQEAYDQLGDDIAVLALNPYDGDDASVAAFKTDNGYTFPMMKCDSRWQNVMQIELYPTTVVVDRFGNICLIHEGMVTDTQTFLNMFGCLISEDYEQTFYKDIGDLPIFEC